MAGGARPRLLCHPARSSTTTLMLPGATAAPMAAKCAFIVAVSARSDTRPTALPRAPHAAPKQVAIAVAMITNDARASPTTRLQTRHHALLANLGLILKPHLHRARRPARPERRTQPRRHKRPEPGPERRPRLRTALRVLRSSRNETPPSGAAGECSRPHTPLRRPPRSSGEYREHAAEPRRRALRPDPTPPNPAQPPTARRRENTPSPRAQTLESCRYSNAASREPPDDPSRPSGPPPPARRLPGPMLPSEDARSVSRPYPERASARKAFGVRVVRVTLIAAGIATPKPIQTTIYRGAKPHRTQYSQMSQLKFGLV